MSRVFYAGASTRRPVMQPFTTLPLQELDDMMNLETEITMSTSRRADLVSCVLLIQHSRRYQL